MQTDPTTQSAENLPLPEVQQAVDLTQSYVESGAKKLETISTIIVGDQATSMGINAKNIQLVLAMIGFITSWKFLTEKAKDKWPYVIGGLVGIVAIRNAISNKSESSPTKSA